LYAGMLVVKITGLSTLQVKLQMSETEAQKLKEGQPAMVIIPSLGDLRLPGHVSRVAKVAQTITRGSKVKQVETIVLIDTTGEGIVPGLTSRCIIEIEKRPDVLVVPLDCVFEKDSLRVVYIHEQGLFEPREVTLGSKSTDFSVVNSGIDGGEELALREPGQSLIKKTAGSAPNQ